MLLLAHRGAPATGSGVPENSVAAVQDALAAGADGVEVDLRLSADDVLVVCHDPDLRRVAGVGLSVAANPWPLLREAADARGVALARCEWLLAAMGGRPVVLELKAPPPAPGAVQRTAAVLVAQLRALGRAGLPLAVTVSSFAPALVDAVRVLATADVRTALLGRPGVRASTLVRQALSAGHDEIHPHVASLVAEPACVEAAHACGLSVTPWTVNRGRVLRRFAVLGVDAVITDVPVPAREALRGRPLRAA